MSSSVHLNPRSGTAPTWCLLLIASRRGSRNVIVVSDRLVTITRRLPLSDTMHSSGLFIWTSHWIDSWYFSKCSSFWNMQFGRFSIVEGAWALEWLGTACPCPFSRHYLVVRAKHEYPYLHIIDHVFKMKMSREDSARLGVDHDAVFTGWGNDFYYSDGDSGGEGDQCEGFSVDCVAGIVCREICVGHVWV